MFDKIQKKFSETHPWLVLRPELGLLYNKRSGQEHQLNKTALSFVVTALESKSLEAALDDLTNRYDVGRDRIESDFLSLWDKILYTKKGQLPRRRSGAPKDWVERDISFPLAVEIELTKVCNWKCDFCYNVWKVFDDFEAVDPSKHITIDAYRSVLDEMYQNNALRLRLSGGEPTLHPKFDELIKIAKPYCFDLELFTNGSLMSNERLSELIESGLRVLLISLHGDIEKHNQIAGNRKAYFQATNAMKIGVESGVDVLAEALIMEENIESIRVMVNELLTIGVKNLSLMPYVPFSEEDPRHAVSLPRVMSFIDELYGEYGRDLNLKVPCAPRHCLSNEPHRIHERVRSEFDNHCGAGLLWMSVAYDGRVRHCPHSNVYAGSVSDGLKSIYTELMRPTIESILNKQVNPECSACNEFSNCRGGCHLTKVKSYPSDDRQSSSLNILH